MRMMAVVFLAAFAAAMLLLCVPVWAQDVQTQNLVEAIGNGGHDAEVATNVGETSSETSVTLARHEQAIAGLDGRLTALQSRVAAGEVKATAEFRRIKAERRKISRRVTPLRRSKALAEIRARLGKLEGKVSKLPTEEKVKEIVDEKIQSFLEERISPPPVTPPTPPAKESKGGGGWLRIFAIGVGIAGLFMILAATLQARRVKNDVVKDDATQQGDATGGDVDPPPGS